MNFKKIFFIILLLICMSSTSCVGNGILSGKKISPEDIKYINDNAQDVPYNYSIILSNKEKIFIIDNLKTSKFYLEFGSGGSTFLALLNSDAKVISVESEKSWIKYLRKWRFIRKNDGKRLRFYYANTGEVSGWGWPVNYERDRELFPQYSQGVFKKYPYNYDLVFIDGRFRVACVLQTILNTNDDVKILIHDFTYRPQYSDVLKFLEIDKAVDTMVLFKKKKNIDKNEVEKLYESYKYDPR